MESSNWVVQNLQNALATWNDKLSEIWLLITQSPEEFKDGTIWNVITNIHGALQAIGYSLLVLFFVVGIMKTCGNFAEMKRPEIALKMFIRFILSKAAIDYGLELMMALFDIVQGIVAKIMATSGLARIDEMVLPESIVTAIEDSGFWESVPLWAVTLIGSLFKRVNTWGAREKWMCSKGCKCSVYIDDAIFEDTVTSNLKVVIRNPDLLNVVADSQYMPTIDVTKEENELIRLLEQPKLNFSVVAKCILQGAKVRFDCCEFDNGELTEELKNEISFVDKIDYKVMKEYIKQIIIQPDGRITTVFINNAKITNGGAENAS